VNGLDARFAGQLSAGGWTRLTSGGAGSLACDLWSLPDYRESEALVVLSPGPGASWRTLFVRLKSRQGA